MTVKINSNSKRVWLMDRNPYTLVFGKEPAQAISRASQSVEIMENFCREEPSQQIYMITGVRGTGKTVFMTDISRKMRQKRDWIVVVFRFFCL